MSTMERKGKKEGPNGWNDDATKAAVALWKEYKLTGKNLKDAITAESSVGAKAIIAKQELKKVGERNEFKEVCQGYIERNGEKVGWKQFRGRLIESIKIAERLHADDDELEEFHDARSMTAAEMFLKCDEEHQKNEHDLVVAQEYQKELDAISDDFGKNAEVFKTLAQKDQQLDEDLSNHVKDISNRVKSRHNMTQSMMDENMKQAADRRKAASKVAALKSKAIKSAIKLEEAKESMKIDDEVQQAEDAAKKPEEEATMSAPSTGGVLWTLLGRKTDPKKESVPKKAPKEETSVAVQPQRGYHVLARKEDSALLVPHSTAAAKTVIIVEKHEQPKPEEPQLESKKAPLATGAEAAKTVRILEEPQAFSSPLADEEKDNVITDNKENEIEDEPKKAENLGSLLEEGPVPRKALGDLFDAQVEEEPQETNPFKDVSLIAGSGLEELKPTAKQEGSDAAPEDVAAVQKEESAFTENDLDHRFVDLGGTQSTTAASTESVAAFLVAEPKFSVPMHTRGKKLKAKTPASQRSSRWAQRLAPEFEGIS